MGIQHLLLTVAALAGLFGVVDPAFAQDWTLTGAPSDSRESWQAVSATVSIGSTISEMAKGQISQPMRIHHP